MSAAALEVLARHSKSFSLAARLLPVECRDDAAVLYAWCRRADDAIDLGAPGPRRAELSRLRRELESVYAGTPQPDEHLAGFQRVVQQRGIPLEYPSALLDGLAMDLGDVAFKNVPELLLYAYRVAGVVGLMMCHVLGVQGRWAHAHAAHLGMAMQLTNICRDVAEDWERRRLYLPADLLAECGATQLCPGGPLPPAAHGPLSFAVQHVIALSRVYYLSGSRGLPALTPRAALAVRSAGLIYAAIGDELLRRGGDVTQGRAAVSRWKKFVLVAEAGVVEGWARLRALLAGFAYRTPRSSS